MNRFSIAATAMDAFRRRRLAGRRALMASVAAVVAVVAVLGALFSSQRLGTDIQVTLAPGSGAPSARGTAQLQLDGPVLKGSISVQNLPSQPFGSGRFYETWFVRRDTGDKAFLGALIQQDSIIFSRPGDGQHKFAATKFTTGPDAGSQISLGPKDTNLIIVLIENKIDGLTPSPVGPVPGTGAAVSGSF